MAARIGPVPRRQSLEFDDVGDDRVVRGHAAERIDARGPFVVHERVADAVWGGVPIADRGQRLGHLGHDAVAESASLTCSVAACGRFGELGDRFGFERDRAEEAVLPDLSAGVRRSAHRRGGP